MRGTLLFVFCSSTFPSFSTWCLCYQCVVVSCFSLFLLRPTASSDCWSTLGTERTTPSKMFLRNAVSSMLEGCSSGSRSFLTQTLNLGFGVPYFNTFFLKEPLWKKSLYFFLPDYLKAQYLILGWFWIRRAKQHDHLATLCEKLLLQYPFLSAIMPLSVHLAGSSYPRTKNIESRPFWSML